MTTVSDDFNRSDENLETSSNWTNFGTGSLQVTSNALSARSANIAPKTGYTGATFGNDQKASTDILDLASGNSWFGICVRAGTGSSGTQGYSAEVRPNGDIECYRSGATLIDDIAAGVSVSDVVEIEASSTTITVRVNSSDVGGGTDASWSSGDPGYVAYMPSGEVGTNIFDNFSATDELGGGGGRKPQLMTMGVS